MKEGIGELPVQVIVSIEWTNNQLYDFFRGLTKGSIFGYSLAFTYAKIVEMAASYGVQVKLLPLSHPWRRKYLYYVLKVASVNDGASLSKNLQATIVYFKDVHYYSLIIAKGNRVCQGHACVAQIPKGSQCFEVVDLVEIPSGKKVYTKKSYCTACADHILSGKVKALTALRKSILSKKYE
jgi:hypothetical protein